MDVYPLLAIIGILYIQYVYGSIMNFDATKECSIIAIPIVSIEKMIENQFWGSKSSIPQFCGLTLRILSPILSPVIIVIAIVAIKAEEWLCWS